MSLINFSLSSKLEKPKLPSPELSPSPESTAEQVETIKKPEAASQEKPVSSPLAVSTSSSNDSLESTNDWRADRARQIDDILAADLGDIFLSLTPDKQQEFKKTGEETVREINNLLDKARVNLGRIITLIRKWLSIIPSINRFFLEQEAKIKADRIIKLKKY